MAKAVVNTTVRTKTVEVRVPDSVTLTLSLEEAIALKGLVGNIGGTPHGTVREFTEDIYEALYNCIKLDWHQHLAGYLPVMTVNGDNCAQYARKVREFAKLVRERV